MLNYAEDDFFKESGFKREWLLLHQIRPMKEAIESAVRLAFLQDYIKLHLHINYIFYFNWEFVTNVAVGYV